MANDAIAAAIAAAKLVSENANSAPAPVQNLPAVSQAGNYARPAPLDAMSMMQGSFNVDAFMKVSEDGVKIGDSGLITEPMTVALDMSEVQYYFAIKYGNPAVYEKTIDHNRTFSGKTWGEAMATGARVDGAKFRGEYRSGDVPMVLLAEAKDLRGNVAGKVGDRLGKSLSTTEWKEFEALLRSIVKAGLNPNDARIKVQVAFRGRSNVAGNKWGVLTFTYAGNLDEEVAQAA